MEDIQEFADSIPDEQVFTPALIIGDPIEGNLYLVSHTCPRCRSKMETAGIGFIKCYCANCWAVSGKSVEMERRFERLDEE